MAGKGILLIGQSGTGKTALAIGMSKELGENIPFVMATASEFFSFTVSKTEALTQAFRSAINVEIIEESETIHGEVVEIIIEKDSLLSADNRNGTTGTLIIKTTAMETQYQIGEKLAEKMERAQIRAGDVVSIDRETGSITRHGRSYSRLRDFDAVSSEMVFVDCPGGEVCRKHKKTHLVSLHDIDVVNSQAQGANSLLSGETGEIPSEIRMEVDKKIDEWQLEGKARVIPGVLFVDEINMLDLECFSFVNSALDDHHSPMLVAATNCERAVIRGSQDETEYPHGAPEDFLDRFLVIKTEPYSREELKCILQIRADEEDVKIHEEAVELLTETAAKTSLRYAMNLITVATVVGMQDGNETIHAEHVSRAGGLFVAPSQHRQ